MAKQPDLDPVPDATGRDRNLRKDRRPLPGAGNESRGIETDVADADKVARTGTTDEQVRNTPPFSDGDDLKH